jgi:DnaJ-class molecular chaperone
VRTCWRCNGSGYIENGDLIDGMMTGYDECPTCRGLRVVTEDQVLDEIHRLSSLKGDSA